jgi:hypothetical protein
MAVATGGSATADQDGAPAAPVLETINQARATAGLPALTPPRRPRPGLLTQDFSD